MTKHKQLGAIPHKNGVTFRVWAPFARFVSVFAGEPYSDKEVILQNEGNGFWSGTMDGAKPGQEYHYHLQTPSGEWVDRVDPYAYQLTASENGKSLIIDPDFDWGDARQPATTLNQQVIYEVHIGTFNRPDAATPGTFETAIEKLDYLKELGVTTVELMPVTAMMASHGWGYSPNHLFAVETAYGGRHGLLEFVKAAHQRGISVILDVVYNHLSGATNLWQFDGWNENGRGGIYFYNDRRGDTPWGTRLDYGRAEVNQFILDNVTMWLADYRLDGLRLDSTIYMRNIYGHNDDPANDIPEAWRLMQRINELTHKINPHALTIAEDVGYNPYITEAIGYGGAGFGSQWDTSFPHALRQVLEPVDDQYRDMSGLIFELTKNFNNDAFRRVVYSDSHDTAANGAARLAEQITPGNSTSVYARKRSLLASIITLTAPGIPMLLQGQEFNENGSFSDWQELDWERAEKFSGIVEAHKHLINLRRNISGNTRGLSGQNVAVIHTNMEGKVIAYHRWMDGGAGDDVIVVVNFSNQTLLDYEVPFPRDGRWTVRFNSSWKGYSKDFKEVPFEAVDVTGTGRIALAPYSALILSQD